MDVRGEFVEEKRGMKIEWHGKKRSRLRVLNTK